MADARPAIGWVMLSGCGQYRYRLERRWDDARPAIGWVMLNPSTADAAVDDATIRRVVAFSARWGYGGAVVGNLFALRATDPRALYSAADPVGPENDDHLRRLAADCATIVAAWGAHGARWPARVAAVRALLPPAQVLGFTKGGQPQHPLRLRADTPLVAWAAGGEGHGRGTT